MERFPELELNIRTVKPVAHWKEWVEDLRPAPLEDPATDGANISSRVYVVVKESESGEQMSCSWFLQTISRRVHKWMDPRGSVYVGAGGRGGGSGRG